MERLEQYINENIDCFNETFPPEGSRERFIEAIRKEEVRRIRILRISSAGVAVAAVAALMLILNLTVDKESLELERNFRALARTEAEILELVDMNYPEEKQIVINTIRSITCEAIPLADLLPKEMGQNERIEILRRYYRQQAESLAILKEEYK